MRAWFAFIAIILWGGIYLTGFSNVNWLLYVPEAGFIFSAITGICLPQIFILRMFSFRIKQTSNQ